MEQAMEQGLQHSVCRVQHDNPWLEAFLKVGLLALCTRTRPSASVHPAPAPGHLATHISALESCA
eukprot:4439440-Prymnesium_polylepis.1